MQMTTKEGFYQGMMTRRVLFISLFLIGFCFITNVIGSPHRVRIDLKIRSPDLLKEKAEAMSKPFPHRGNPLSWPDIIGITGRTKEEMNKLISTITDDLGGTDVKECPSKQCIVAKLDVDDENIILDGIADSSTNGGNEDATATATANISDVETFLDRRLRQAFEDSGNDHTIISGVTRLLGQFVSPDVLEQTLSNDPEAAVKQNFVFHYITTNILEDRMKVSYEALNNANNYDQFLVIPAICDQNATTMYFSMEKANSQSQSSCPTEIKLTVSPWYAEDLATSENITYTIFTEDLEKTDMCSQYNNTICKNSFETNFHSLNGAIDIVGQDAEGNQYNTTFKFRNDTVLRILELGQFLDPGIAYYNVQIEYPEWNIITYSSSLPVYAGPMITPDYGNDKYNVPEGHEGAGLGVTALTIGSPNMYSEDALSAFLNGFDIPIPDVQQIKSSVFQGNNYSACFDPNADGACYESDLDVQTISTYGRGADIGFLAGGQQAANYTPTEIVPYYDTFVYFREAFIENNLTPDVMSLSWTQPQWTVSEDLDNILMEFTAVGITVLAASGDRGAAGSSFYLTSGPQPCSATKYYPMGSAFTPAGSPWVLAVGATMEADLVESDGIGPAACMGTIGGMITSTGLIQPSDVVELPDYQKNAVEGYINSDAYKHWPFQPSFDSPGRGIPDVSAYGNNIPYITEQENGDLLAYALGGTSASSPTFAGLLLQVRGALLSSPECEGIDVKFGHINPMIYWASENRPDAFTDITVGNNVFDGQMGFEYNTQYCGFGYVATEGWDPVTGVGMMNFPGFVEAAKEYYCTGIQ